jgi:hypothetical protein
MWRSAMGWFRGGTSSRGGGDDDTSAFEKRLAAIEPGVPGRCPSCDGLGYIDDLDLGRRYQIQHCKSCGHRWEYLFDADAHVVGVTELDDDGRPVARMRVRNQVVAGEADPRGSAAPVPPPAPAPPAEAGAEDAAIDLRDAADGAVVDLREPDSEDAGTGPDEMTPAEWLRHSLRR